MLQLTFRRFLRELDEAPGGNNLQYIYQNVLAFHSLITRGCTMKLYWEVTGGALESCMRGPLTEVSRKLEELSELQGLRKDVQRIAVALEKLAGIESQDSEKEQFLWPESEREVQGSKRKGKQKEKRIDGVEEEKEIGGQEEKNRIESVEEGSSNFSLVTYSVGVRGPLTRNSRARSSPLEQPCSRSNIT